MRAYTAAAARGGGEDMERERSAVGLDLLDLFEAMGERYKEKHEALLAMPWKLFCAKWGRLYKYAHEERERKRQQDEQRQEREEWARLLNHARRRGWSSRYG